MESVEFQLQLQDQMTAALRSGAESALKMDAALDKLLHKLESVEKEEQKEKEEEQGLFAKAVEKGELMKDLLEKVAEKVYELGKELVSSTIEITDFGVKAENALRRLNGETEGSQERTTRMLAEAAQFANDAALPIDQVKESFLGLKKAGLSDEWVRPLTAAAADLAALSGHPENYRAISQEFEQIALKGELSGRALLSLQRDGINTAALAARLGAKDFRELQETLSKKPLEALPALRAIEDVIKSTAHEDFLGQLTKQDADQTFGGSIQRIKNAWSLLLESFNTDDTFKGLRDDFSVLSRDIISHLPEWEKQFTNALDPLIKAFDQFIKNPDALKNVFTDALTAVEAVGTAASWVVKALEFISGHKNLLEGAATTATIAAIPGVGLPAAAIGGGLATVFGSETAAEKKYRQDTFGAASGGDTPYIGSHDTGGPIEETGPHKLHDGEFVIPVGGVPVVRDRGGSGGDRSGSSIHAPINVTVHVEGAAGMTEHGLSLELTEMLPGALVSPIERLAATVGAT